MPCNETPMTHGVTQMTSVTFVVVASVTTVTCVTIQGHPILYLTLIATVYKYGKMGFHEKTIDNNIASHFFNGFNQKGVAPPVEFYLICSSTLSIPTVLISVLPKQEFSLSAETEYSAAINHRIFGFGRIFGNFPDFRTKVNYLLHNQHQIGNFFYKLVP